MRTGLYCTLFSAGDKRIIETRKSDCEACSADHLIVKGQFQECFDSRTQLKYLFECFSVKGHFK